jgi:hypothetical protein
MRLKVKLKFVEPWSEIISQVAKHCNMTEEEYCRRAVQVLTKQGLEEGEKQNAKSGTNNLAGNAETVRTSNDANSNALSNPKDNQLSVTS